jgi:NAD(P)-dependent dehydrogenase (short-subunit alcohol dehydrogenase family)
MADSNRTVLITGAAQGLGRAMSLGLLEQGFSVAAVDRDSNGIAALREQIAAGPKFEGFVADLTDFDAAKLAGEVEKRFGRIDILINTPVSGRDR